MAIKRKQHEQETVTIDNQKRMRVDDDRLSALPESLQLHILTFLDAKQAVQASTLSKSWDIMWTRLPVLKLISYAFNNIRLFDKFVYNALRRRDRSSKLEKLRFHRSKICSAKLLKSVFDYASMFDVEQLEVYVQHSRNQTWPICPLTSFDSLKSLKLESQSDMSCPFIGSSSTSSFKNLTALHLKRVIITDHDRFTEFPVLESLTLINCHLCETKPLSIQALRLTDLTISTLESINCCELTTPKLKLFDYRGANFPLLRIHEGVPDLETAVIGFHGYCNKKRQKLMFDDVLAMFCALRNVKSLTVFSSVVELLGIFPEELGRRRSPFGELKELKMDFRYYFWQNLFDSPCKGSFESFEVPLDVKAFLLHNCPDAKFTFTSPMILGQYSINLCRCY
ncbi:hypothetical protein LXL04_024663 [Taraxacum kok-saghyz]